MSFSFEAYDNSKREDLRMEQSQTRHSSNKSKHNVSPKSVYPRTYSVGPPDVQMFGFTPAQRCQYRNKKNIEPITTNQEKESQHSSKNFERLEMELTALVRPKSAPIDSAASIRRRQLKAKLNTSSKPRIQSSRSSAQEYSIRSTSEITSQVKKTDPLLSILNNKAKSEEICIAASKGDIEKILKLCKGSHLIIQRKGFKGFTPLHHACRNGHFKLVVLLLTRFGANINVETDEGETPLHIATYYGHSSIVEFLLQQPDCKIDARNSQGETALFISCIKLHNHITYDMLILTRADMRIEDRYGDLPQDVSTDRFLSHLLSQSSVSVHDKFFSITITWNIFSMLTPKELINCRKVSKRWNWIINQNKTLCKIIETFEIKRRHKEENYRNGFVNDLTISPSKETSTMNTRKEDFGVAPFLAMYSPKY